MSVDRRLEELEKETPKKELVLQLMDQIEKHPELLSLLLILHYELYRLGVTPSSEREFTTSQRISYLWAYAWKLSKLSDTFWEYCYILDIAKGVHGLEPIPMDVGLLDPKNFTAEQFNMLQSGIYKGLDFRDIPIPGHLWAKRQPIPLLENET